MLYELNYHTQTYFVYLLYTKFMVKPTYFVVGEIHLERVVLSYTLVSKCTNLR